MEAANAEPGKVGIVIPPPPPGRGVDAGIDGVVLGAWVTVGS